MSATTTAGAAHRRARRAHRRHAAHDPLLRGDRSAPCGERRKGSHRTYDEADVERVPELTRLRDLLNLSLDELKQIVEAEEARAIPPPLPRDGLRRGAAAIVEEALPHVETQLELVRRRRGELAAARDELVARRKSLLARKRQLAS